MKSRRIPAMVAILFLAMSLPFAPHYAKALTVSSDTQHGNRMNTAGSVSWITELREDSDYFLAVLASEIGAFGERIVSAFGKPVSYAAAVDASQTTPAADALPPEDEDTEQVPSQPQPAVIDPIAHAVPQQAVATAEIPDVQISTVTQALGILNARVAGISSLLSSMPAFNAAGTTSGQASPMPSSSNDFQSQLDALQQQISLTNRINSLSNVTLVPASGSFSTVGTISSGVWNASPINAAYGGTGLSAAPTYGEVMLGNSSGGYSLVATSSLGISGSAQFSVQYPLAYNSTTSVLSLALSTTTTNSWSAVQIFNGGTLSTNSTTTNLAVTGGSYFAGNVAVGTTTPYSALEVFGPNTASTSAFAVINSASTTEFAVLDNGNATLAGNLIQNSDQRLKTDITNLDGSSSLAELNALNPVTFNWIDPEKSSVPQFGFIAQDVQKVFPNLVSITAPTPLTPDGTLSLNYIDLISPIIAAIQELSREIAAIRSTVTGFAQKFTTDELCVGSTCVTPVQFQAMVAAANQSSTPPSNSSPLASAATNTPPVISVSGNNPAIVNVGASYADLGATITSPQADLNLGISASLDGATSTSISSITIDTSTPGTHIITYIATDQNGLVGTASRTVRVVDADTDAAATSTDSTSDARAASTTAATSPAQQ